MPNEIQIIQISQVVCSLFVNNYISLSLSLFVALSYEIW